MALRAPAPDSPFLAHALDGWTPALPHIRFPVTCGIYREGDNLALYLTPASVGAMARALALPDPDLAVVLSDGPALASARTLRWDQLSGLGPDVDLVHLPAGTDPAALSLDDLPTPLLANPDAAVPTALGGRAALSLQDGCHGAVIAREHALLARCLAGFLEEYVLSALSRDSAVPALDADALAPLLEPLPAGCFYGLRFEAHRRYWCLDAELHDGDGVCDRYRLVCEGDGGRWRRGWSW